MKISCLSSLFTLALVMFACLAKVSAVDLGEDIKESELMEEAPDATAEEQPRKLTHKYYGGGYGGGGYNYGGGGYGGNYYGGGYSSGNYYGGGSTTYRPVRRPVRYVQRPIVQPIYQPVYRQPVYYGCRGGKGYCGKAMR